KSGDRRGRVENYLRTVKTQSPCAFRKMAVVANVDADSRKRGIKNRIAKIARTEIKLFPESRVDMGNVVLAILPKILTVRIYHRRSVVIDPGNFFLVNRYDQHHAVRLRHFLHQ